MKRLKDMAACTVVPPIKVERTIQTLKSAARDRNLELVIVDASEFAKVDALTCKCILIYQKIYEAAIDKRG